QRIHRTDKIGLLLRPLEQRARTHAHRQRAIGLAMRDLAAQQAGAVLRRGGFDAAARIQNGDDKGVKFFLDGLDKRYIENLAGDVEGEFSHGWIPYAEVRDKGLSGRCRGSSPARG